MKYMKTLLFILSIVLLFSSCSNQRNFDCLYDNDISIDSISDAQIPKDDLEMINLPFEVQSSLSRVLSFNLLKDNWSIGSVLRYNNGKYYSIDKLDEDRLLLILYREMDDADLMVIDGVVVSKLISKDDFSKIVVGISKSDVFSIDSNAVFEEKYSYHRLSDGTMFRITYENNKDELVVSSIDEMNTDNSVIQYLIDKDLKLIT